MTASIRPIEAEHGPSLLALVNAHLDTVIPGWALSEAYLFERLQRNPEQYVIDPWVVGRATLGAFEDGRLVAAAHLLHYGAGGEVGNDYRNAGDLAWFAFWPEAGAAAANLLAAADGQLADWGVGRAYAWDAGLPIGLVGGVPDEWPHIGEALTAAGYAPSAERREAVYGGWLQAVPAPPAPPLPGLTLRRTLGRAQARWAACVDNQVIGHCEGAADLTQGGALPALRGWAELGELYVTEGWRGRGVGAWLVQHAAAWLRLGGCDRIVLSVAADDEARGAGRFYRRFGWEALSRWRRGWGRG